MEEKDLAAVKNDFPFQQKEYIIKWFFWLLMALFLMADFMGVFGKGYLSSESVQVGPNRVEYDKHLRMKMESMLIVHANSGQISVGFNDDYFQSIRVSSVYPSPQSMFVRNGEVIYNFSTSMNGKITFFIEPLAMGWHSLTLDVSGNTANLDQLVYF